MNLKRVIRKIFRNGKSKEGKDNQKQRSFQLKDNPQYQQYEIGEYSYGNPIIKSWDNKTHLKIGRFCSIASNVQILLGGEHRTDWISTYPFNTLFSECSDVPGHPSSKGDITIGNDVWIGQNVIILSGVTIGNGAVIGAGSVVTKDVPAYAIVCGNPARVIRKRFSEERILAMEKIAWWDWPIEEILSSATVLMSNDIEEFIEKATPLKP